MFEQIEKVKQEYTDKYVKVDANRAELARFKDLVGQVKTVNMSGRALVEFMDYHLNIGWFDIDLDYLKVVDKPEPKPKEEKKPAAKKAAPKKAAAPAAEKKLSPLELARQADGGAAKKDGGEKKGGAEKKSTADVLAALRGEKGGGDAKGAAKPTEAKAETPAEKPAPAKKSGGAMDRSKMSVADMIAAAKGESAPAKEEPASEPEVEEEAVEESADNDIVIEEAPAESASSEGVSGPVDKSGMSVDEMVAYCREHDA